jgi:hypothetical protein
LTKSTLIGEIAVTDAQRAMHFGWPPEAIEFLELYARTEGALKQARRVKKVRSSRKLIGPHSQTRWAQNFLSTSAPRNKLKY